MKGGKEVVNWVVGWRVSYKIQRPFMMKQPAIHHVGLSIKRIENHNIFYCMRNGGVLNKWALKVARSIKYIKFIRVKFNVLPDNKDATSRLLYYPILFGYP